MSNTSTIRDHVRAIAVELRDDVRIPTVSRHVFALTRPVADGGQALSLRQVATLVSRERARDFLGKGADALTIDATAEDRAFSVGHVQISTWARAAAVANGYGMAVLADDAPASRVALANQLTYRAAQAIGRGATVAQVTEALKDVSGAQAASDAMRKLYVSLLPSATPPADDAPEEGETSEGEQAEGGETSETAAPVPMSAEVAVSVLRDVLAAVPTWAPGEGHAVQVALTELAEALALAPVA